MPAITSKSRLIIVAFAVMAIGQGAVIYLTKTAPPTTNQLILIYTGVAAGALILLLVGRREAKDIIKSAQNLRDRESTSDEDFISACGLIDNPASHRVALAVRRVLAEQGRAISSDKIRADDSLSHPMWEGLCWETIRFLVGRKGALELSSKLSSLNSDSQVRDAVKLLAADARALTARQLLESFGEAGDPHCIECGYNLHGLPAESLCPECGAGTTEARWLNISQNCGYDDSIISFLINGIRWIRKSQTDVPSHHLHAKELCEGLAGFALKWSKTPAGAADLLSRMNLCNSEQVGALVYILIAYKLLHASASDSIEDFDGLGDLTMMLPRA